MKYRTLVQQSHVERSAKDAAIIQTFASLPVFVLLLYCGFILYMQGWEGEMSQRHFFSPNSRGKNSNINQTKPGVCRWKRENVSSRAANAFSYA